MNTAATQVQQTDGSPCVSLWAVTKRLFLQRDHVKCYILPFQAGKLAQRGKALGRPSLRTLIMTSHVQSQVQPVCLKSRIHSCSEMDTKRRVWKLTDSSLEGSAEIVRDPALMR